MFTQQYLFILITTVLLSSSVNSKDASFTTKVKGISADLENALGEILNDQTVNFTSIPKNTTYNSSVRFEHKGTNELYNVTKIVVKFLSSKEPIPKNILKYDENGNVKTEPDDIIKNWFVLVKNYWAIILIYAVGILFAGIMPLAMFFFCICRCCGKCGARTQPYDGKHDTCRKFYLATFLIALTTLLLFGVCSSFITNSYMQNGVDELPTVARTTVNDVQKYITFVQTQLNVLFNVNFNELKKNFIQILDESGEIVSNKLKEYSNAVSLSQLANIVNVLPEVSRDLHKMKLVTNQLRANASRLNDGLRSVKRDLLQELRKCQDAGVKECKDFNDVGKLDTNVDFDKYLDRYFPRLPDVTDLLRNITEILDSNIVKEVEEGKKAFDNIQKEIQRAVDDSIPVVKDAINKAGDAMSNNAENISNELTRTNDMIRQNTYGPIHDADVLLAQHSIYRWYVGLAISSILLLVALCASCGLLCGICGRRPDGYGDDCCDKGTGSRFLMIGVFTIFLFSSALMLIFLLLMTIGIFAQNFVCDPLRDPTSQRSEEIWKLINSPKSKMFRQSHHQSFNDIDITIQDIITSCHQNLSIYKVLKLEQKYNVDELETYLKKYDINKKISIIKDKIKMDHDIIILKPEAKYKLQKLSDSGLGDINYDRFTEVLRDNITSINLNDLALKLNETANKISNDRSNLHEIKYALSRNALYLDMYYNMFVVPMIKSAIDLKETAIRLEIGLKFNHSSFHDAVNDLLHEVEEAQEYLQRNGTKDIAHIAENFAVNLEQRVQYYLNYLSVQLRDEVGQCGPLSRAYNSSVVALCDNIILPFNGFWVSIGWCLLLFIPILVISVKLSTLYQKMGSYPGHIPEPVYNLYDPYTEHEFITRSRQKYKKKSKKHGRGPLYHQEATDPNEYAMEPHGALPPVSSSGDSATAGSSRDPRYTDMAKRWEEFPSEVPPNYQTAPVAPEYERPPPYYFPGPGGK